MSTAMRVLTILACCAAVLACAGEPNPTDRSSTVTVDTLETGRIVIRNPEQPAQAGSEVWTARELFRIGSPGGAESEIFGDVVDLAIDRQGQFYVLDGQAAEVRIFGPDGAFLRTLGGPGQGPGELSSPAGLAIDADGLVWVVNWGNARYTAYDGDSGRLHVEKRRLARFGVFPWPGGIDSSGRMIDVGLASGDGSPVILRLDTAFVPTDTLPMPRESPESLIAFRRAGRMVAGTPVPFAPRPYWAAHPAGGVIVGEGEEYRLHHIDFSGDTLRTIELARQRIPVASAERDSALARFEVTRERVASAGGVAERDVEVPTHKPAHSRLFFDDESRVWVESPGSEGELGSWDVFDRSGRLVAWVPIPVPLGGALPAVRDGRLAVTHESAGGPVVIVYEIR